MHFDDPIETENRLFVPSIVRQSLQKFLKSTTKIIVSEKRGRKEAKINGLRLTTKLGQLPVESLDDIANAVVSIMHSAWYAQETEDPDEEVGLPPMDFVVVCEYWLPGPPKQRVRNQFAYIYHGGSAGDEYEEVNNDVESHGLNMLLGHYERFCSMQMTQLNDATDRLVKVVEQQTISASAGSEIMREAIPLFLSGIQATMYAKHTEFSIAKANADAEREGQNTRVVLKGIAPFLPIMVMTIASKFGLDPSVVQSAVDSAMSGNDEGEEGSEPSATPPGADAGQYQTSDENVLAQIGKMFGASLTNDQNRQLTALLTKKQRALFDDLFCATTDEESFAAYNAIALGAADKFAVLQQLCTREQLDDLKAYMSACVTYSSSKQTAGD